VPDCHARLTDGKALISASTAVCDSSHLVCLHFGHGRRRHRGLRPDPGLTSSSSWRSRWRDSSVMLCSLSSTAAPRRSPDLAAKHIVDLQVTVGSLADADRLAPAFKRAGYSGVAVAGRRAVLVNGASADADRRALEGCAAAITGLFGDRTPCRRARHVRGTAGRR
jgi:hypothetical protein